MNELQSSSRKALVGRDLIHNEEHGWALFETVSSNYSRTSRWCKTKLEIIEALINNGVSIQVADMLDSMDHLPSIMMGSGGMFSTLQIDQAMAEAGLDVSDDPNQAIPYLYDDEEE